MSNFSYKINESPARPRNQKLRESDNTHISISNNIGNGNNNSSNNEDYVAKNDIIKSLSQEEPSDRKLFSSLKASLMFLRKNIDDTISGLITFTKGLIATRINCKEELKVEGLTDLNLTTIKKLSVDDTAEFAKDITSPGVKSDDYQPGILGSGYSIHTRADGTTQCEVDDILIRRTAIFNEIIIQQLKYQGGIVIYSAAGITCTKVIELDDVYRCYFDTKKGSVRNEFEKMDQARCQRFSGGVKYYWRLVTGVGEDYIDLSKLDCDNNSSVPSADDIIIQLGSRINAERQAAKITTTIGADSPRDEYYEGINTYNLESKLITTIGKKEGKTGIYTVNGEFTGKIKVKSNDNNTVLPVTVYKGNYVNGAKYYYYDEVTYDGSRYICIAIPYTTYSPNNQSEWILSVSKGDAGEQGMQGVRGLQGEKGEHGIPGPKGENGKTTYFHIKYSAVANPSAEQMSEIPAKYIGTYVDYTPEDSKNPLDYRWYKHVGTDGIAGTNGKDGLTSYLHIKYSDDLTTFTANDGEDSGIYIGHYVDFIQKDSMDISRYQWDKIKGEDANLLDWVKDWDSNSTIIGDKKVITPKIFAGEQTLNGLSGVVIGTGLVNIGGKEYSGLVGLKGNKITFHVDSDTGDTLFGGEIRGATGNIGGFDIETGRLVSTSENGQQMLLSSNIIRFTDQYTSMYLGADTLPASSGGKDIISERVLMNRYTEKYYSQGNIAKYISVEGAAAVDDIGAQSSGNHAMYIPKGDICGLRLRTRRVSSSQTLSVMDSIVMVVGSGPVRLTLPAAPEDGQLYFISKLGDQKNIEIYCSTGAKIRIGNTEKQSWLHGREIAFLCYDKVNDRWAAGVMVQ